MNAPTMPVTRPRSTGVWPMNRQPSQIDLAVDGTEYLLACRLGISVRDQTVSAETAYDAALMYRAR